MRLPPSPHPSTCSGATRRRATRTWSRWSARRCFRSRSCAALARRRSWVCRIRTWAATSGSARSTSRRSGSSSARPPSRGLLADRQPLLRARHRLVARRESLAKRRDVLGDFFEPLEDLLVLPAGGAGLDALHAFLDPVEG